MTEGSRWQFTGFVVVLAALYFVLRVGMGLGPLVPDLLTVAVLLAARRLRPGATAGLALALGVLDGAANPPVMGASALALLLVGFLGSRFRDLLAGDSPVLLFLYLFAGKWLYDIILYVVVEIVSSAGPLTSLLLESPLAALYAAAAGVAAAAVYRSLV